MPNVYSPKSVFCPVKLSVCEETSLYMSSLRYGDSEVPIPCCIPSVSSAGEMAHPWVEGGTGSRAETPVGSL